MKTILVGACEIEHLYQMRDPEAPTEAEFEYSAARALACVYSTHRCILFRGGFRYDQSVYRPDLALVARDFSHWFVIEVELLSHSFENHVLPQVKAFQYGSPEPDCAIELASQFAELSLEQARTFVEYVPRRVAVVANKRDPRWEIALRALGIDLAAVLMFRSSKGVEALELDGTLEILSESLGFGIYSATDRSLRFHRSVRVPAGAVQIADPSGAVSSWTVTPAGDATWLTKDVGSPDIEHESYVQLIRTIDGRVSLRTPPTRGRLLS